MLISPKHIAMLLLLAIASLAAGCGESFWSEPVFIKNPTVCTTDNSAPILSIPTPAGQSMVSDSEFRSTGTFFILIKYQDNCPMNASSLHVTFQMDNGTPADITSYFSFVNATSIKSTDSFITDFAQHLFNAPTNDHTRTMRIAASIQDITSVIGSTATTFFVYPLIPPSP
jgi:hypothetical protein